MAYPVSAYDAEEPYDGDGALIGVGLENWSDWEIRRCWERRLEIGD